jgi:hypothetical protein
MIASDRRSSAASTSAPISRRAWSSCAGDAGLACHLAGEAAQYLGGLILHAGQLDTRQLGLLAVQRDDLDWLG